MGKKRLIAVCFVPGALAEIITQACLYRWPVTVGEGADVANKFDDREFLTTSVDSKMQINGYKECYSAEGKLNGLAFGLVHKEDPATQVWLPSVGQVDDSCEEHTFASNVITQAAITYDESTNCVGGIRFKSTLAVDDIGILQDDTAKIYQFSDEYQLIGSWGATNANCISALGFVMHSPACSEQADIEI